MVHLQERNHGFRVVTTLAARNNPVVQILVRILFPLTTQYALRSIPLPFMHTLTQKIA